MRAVRVLDGSRAVLTTVADPVLRPGTVRLDVAAAGICHSDLNVVHGLVGAQWPRPFTLGHEIAGVVTEVGADVDPSWVGRRCAVYAPTGCHSCSSCEAGAWNYCTRRQPSSEAGLGLGGDGGLAEQICVDPRRLIAVDDLPLEVAAVLTDAGLTAYHATSVVPASNGAVIVVIGIGGLGHLALQCLRIRQDAVLIGVDRRTEARELALRSGADHFASPGDVESLVRDLGRDGYATAVLDFVGSDATLSQGLQLIGPGGHLVVVGSGGGSLTLSKTDPRVPRGVHVHLPSWGSLPELAAVIGLARDGSIRPTVTTVGLDQSLAAMEQLTAGTVLGRLVAVP